MVDTCCFLLPSFRILVLLVLVLLPFERIAFYLALPRGFLLTAIPKARGKGEKKGTTWKWKGCCGACSPLTTLTDTHHWGVQPGAIGFPCKPSKSQGSNSSVLHPGIHLFRGFVLRCRLLSLSLSLSLAFSFFSFNYLSRVSRGYEPIDIEFRGGCVLMLRRLAGRHRLPHKVGAERNGNIRLG